MGSGEDLNPKGAAGRAKPQLHLIPVGALAPVSRVMELGAKKYGPYNWRQTPVNYTTYLSAAMRHIVAHTDGEDQDPESGQSHLAHAAAGLMILLDAIITGNAKDDRPPKNPAYVEPDPVKPVLSGGEWAPGISCQCEACQVVRKIDSLKLYNDFAKAVASAVEQPADSAAADQSRAGEKATPLL